MSFKSMQLDPRVRQGLEAAGYEEATPIQSAAIPPALEGRDLIGTAQTGTGKTAAFILPILNTLLSRPGRAKDRPRALIVTPTRELAEQIHEVTEMLGRFTPVRSATVYGGVGMQPQAQALRRGVEIIVACPGRLLDHAERKNAKLDQVEILVLDEADRMLDMGFLPAIQRILKLVPERRQTMLFSATFDPSLEKLIGKALHQPQRFAMDVEAPASTVTHAMYPVKQHLKHDLLRRIMQDIQSDSVLIFTRTKHRADRVAAKIQREGFRAEALHADKSQSQRKQALDHFKAGKVKVLVATDIAARGLDIEKISHVINFDMPDSANAYIHRIGRTGRACRSGEAFTLCTPDDHDLVTGIEYILDTPFERRTLKGFDYDVPAPETPFTTGPRRRGFAPRRTASAAA